MGLIAGPGSAPIFVLPGCGCNSETCYNFYAVSANDVNKKITGALDADVSAGVTLQVNLSALSGT